MFPSYTDRQVKWSLLIPILPQTGQSLPAGVCVGLLFPLFHHLCKKGNCRALMHQVDSSDNQTTKCNKSLHSCSVSFTYTHTLQRLKINYVAHFKLDLESHVPGCDGTQMTVHGPCVLHLSSMKQQDKLLRAGTGSDTLRGCGRSARGGEADGSEGQRFLPPLWHFSNVQMLPENLSMPAVFV